MYTNKMLLMITNLSERGAVIAILASISKLKEKNRFVSGAPLSIKAKSPRFTKPAQSFLTKNLRNGFSLVEAKFIERTGVIVATVTPK